MTTRRDITMTARLAILVCLCCAWSAAAAGTLDQLYEKAHFLETGRGDVAGAMKIYEQIASQAIDAGNTAVIRKSLLKLGALAQKQGDAATAEDCYRRLVTELGSSPQDTEVDIYYAGVDKETERFLRESNKSFSKMNLFLPDTYGDQFTDYVKRSKTDEWQEQLKGHQNRETQFAIEGLGALRCTEAIPDLIEIAANQRICDNATRWAAVRALGRIGDKRAVPELIHLVDYYNVNTKYWSRASLYRLTGQYFGDDKEAWANWWKQQHGSPAYDPTRKYPTREEAIAFFDGQRTSQPEASGPSPHVVTSVPAAGDSSVDPNLKELRVTFSEPMMNGAWSWCGGGPTFPTMMGNPRYLRDGKTCVLPVKLEPNHEYEIYINSESYKNFKSVSGVPATPYELKFTTRSN